MSFWCLPTIHKQTSPSDVLIYIQPRVWTQPLLTSVGFKPQVDPTTFWACQKSVHTHTHTHTRLKAPFLGLPGWAGTRKVKTNLDFTEAWDSEWQWHQLGCIQVCTTLQTDNHTSTPPRVFTGRMPFLPPNQQCQSTEGTSKVSNQIKINTSDDFRDWIT